MVPPVEVKINPKIYENYRGGHLLSPDFAFTFFRQSEQLWLEATGRGKMQVFAASETEFFFKGINARFHFVLGKDSEAESVLLSGGGEEMSGPRFTRVVPKPEELAKYAGDYHSDELGALYSLSQDNGQLVLHYPRGTLTLEPIRQNTFIGGYPVGNLQIVRDPAGVIPGFKLTSGRNQKSLFREDSSCDQLMKGNNSAHPRRPFVYYVHSYSRPMGRSTFRVGRLVLTQEQQLEPGGLVPLDGSRFACAPRFAQLPW